MLMWGANPVTMDTDGADGEMGHTLELWSPQGL